MRPRGWLFLQLTLYKPRNFVYKIKKKHILNMETILEQQRRYHEEKERLMDAKTKEMLYKKSTVSHWRC